MPDSPSTLAVVGAAGRMGRRLVALAAAHDLQLVAAVDHDQHPDLGKDAGTLAGVDSLDVTLTSSLPTDSLPQVLIDFSSPAGTAATAAWCAEHGVALVVGTTGLTDDHHAALDDAAKSIAVCQATNFSLVVNVLWKLAAEAAQLLGNGYDLEVLEAHHRHKQDAPSGTALTLVQRLCEATGRDFNSDVVYCRQGDAPRKPRDIGVQTLRIGDDVGQHTAFFAAEGERLEIKHVSTSRDSYVTGALRAAKWLVDQPAGRYDMTQVLGL